jgi:opine dehydrogenase
MNIDNDKSCLVIGGGGIGMAAAVLEAAHEQKVFLFTRRQTSMPEKRIINSIGKILPGTYSIHCSSNLLSLAAFNGGSLPNRVIIGCRGNDIEDIAKKLTPFVHKNMSILLMCSSRFPASSFLGTLESLGVKTENLPGVADFKTPPFVSRAKSDNIVNISAFKQIAPIAAQTPEETDRIIQDHKHVFPNLVAIQSSLELNLRKCDDIIHLPLLATRWNDVETIKDHNIYRTATARTTKLITQLDRERLEIGNYFGLELIDVCAGYQESYGTPGPTLLEHFNQIPAYANATIQDPYHRFLFEDVPYGAVPLQSIARFAGVETPLLDAFITLSYNLVDLSPGWTLHAEDFAL